ncbi:hypothetical protein A6410_05080 [Prescottella equi]|nr:hypothetical protein A6410_05080 [Prescottella equi]
MRRAPCPRLAIVGAVSSVVALGALGAPAIASADPQVTTAEFSVPVGFAAACTLTVWVCVPNLTTVTPSATTGAPGEVAFTAHVTLPGYSCPDLSVRWLNLATGTSGTTELRRVPVDYSRPVAADEWCRYAPVLATTGGGTLVATADAGSVVTPGGFQVLVNPGFGTFNVP